MAKKAINRAVSLSELVLKSFKILPFDGVWLESFGEPERSGSWLIWGPSGNGKTRFALQLAKYLAQFEKVAYNSLEEGASLSLRKAIIETGLLEVKRRFVVLDKEPIEELEARLMKHKSPNIVFIDSLQYTGFTKMQYKAFVNKFPNKLFIFISHAQGKNPEGRLGLAVRHDANVKLRVEGYKVPAPVSRYGGGKSFTIWPDGAADYWGEF